MKLQYQMGSGNWADCDERSEMFFDLILKNNGVDAAGKICPMFRAIRPLTIVEAEAALVSGMTLRNDPSEWYSNCRIAPEKKATIKQEKLARLIVCKECGCSGVRGAHPFSVGYAGNICDDCDA